MGVPEGAFAVNFQIAFKLGVDFFQNLLYNIVEERNKK
jgi:hypothetical protein